MSASEVRRSSHIDERRYVFRRFSVENERSVVAVVMGRVAAAGSPVIESAWILTHDTCRPCMQTRTASV